MATTITVKGQVTIPKHVREAAGLKPRSRVEFRVNREGHIELHKADARGSARPDRFERALGKAQIKWRTDELMALLRGDD